MRCWKILIPLVLICSAAAAMESRLPFSTVFRGQDQFNRLVAKAKSANWTTLPIGERTAAVGQFSRNGLLDVFRNRPQLCPDAERAGVELDSGTFAALHRDRPLSQRRMHRRISFASALFGGLALRQ